MWVQRIGFKSTARARVRPSFAAAEGTVVDQPGRGFGGGGAASKRHGRAGRHFNVSVARS